MKKLITAALSIALCLEVVVPTVMLAAPNALEASVSQLSQEKQNFIFLEGKPGDAHLVYTYESNGDTYKVEERANKDFTEVDSTIYVKNAEGEFVKHATQNAIIDTQNSLFQVTTNENGVTETETQNFGVDPTDLSTIPNIPMRPDRGDLITPFDSYMGGAVSAWYYGSWVDGSSKIERYTVTAVTALLIGLATAANPSAAVATSVIGTMALTIVQDQIPLVYYKRRYAEKKSLVATTVIVGSKWDTIFYSNSARTNELDRTTATKFLSGYVAD
ncbi:hypothetical protein HW560_18750 [Paenibacillus sp. E222]|uniref:hypothetical protein n=1 Tax=Paenibacillus sp. E222 TaxID=2748863 RepID=UPI0015C67575|nr:hypothetical protein [Paenibacillus sp. E222]QLG39942.1 hypothetical protein HW560_18750 [Paenibacillus sp. E222]